MSSHRTLSRGEHGEKEFDASQTVHGSAELAAAELKQSTTALRRWHTRSIPANQWGDRLAARLIVTDRPFKVYNLSRQITKYRDAVLPFHENEFRSKMSMELSCFKYIKGNTSVCCCVTCYVRGNFSVRGLHVVTVSGFFPGAPASTHWYG